MNKKLIALAIAAGVAAPMAANADVTVYGVAQLELVNVKVTGADTENALVDSKNSRLGVKWSEDLGGGLSAVGEMEFGPNFLDAANKETCTLKYTDTNSDTPATVTDDTITCANSAKSGLYARQANLGLKGSFGEVRFGTNLQPYKYSGGVKYDAFVATGAEARSGNGGMLKSHFGQGGYFANSISYKGKFNNVLVWVATSIEKDADVNTAYKGSKGDIMAAVTVGLGKGAEVGVAMATDKYKTTEAANVDGEKNRKIFGKYTIGAHQILAQYETSDLAGGSSKDLKDYFLGYRFTMGKNMFVAQLGQEKSEDSSTKTGYLAVGAVHNLSKKTRAFVAYRKSDDKTTSDVDVTAISLGMTTKF